MPNDPAVAVTDTTDQDKPLTRADILALLTESLPGVVNAAVTNHAKRLQKDFDKKLAALTPAPKPEGEGEGEGVEVVDLKAPKTGAAAGALPAATVTDPRYAELEKKLAKLTKDNEASAKQAKEERRARLDSDGYASVRQALTGKVKQGVESTVLDLLRGRNAIAIGDDGAVRIRLGAKDEPEEGLDLSEGVAAYLKTSEAGLFAPVPTATTPPGRRPLPSPGPTAPRPAPNTTAHQGADAVAAFEAKHGNIADAL
jgi:hypothetical protein